MSCERTELSEVQVQVQVAGAGALSPLASWVAVKTTHNQWGGVGWGVGRMGRGGRERDAH